MKQADIEIYIKDTNLPAVTQWLTKVLGNCSEWQQKGKLYKCIARQHIPITWYPKAVGSWNCLHFDSEQTPWDNDLACAKDANLSLNVEIRCSPNDWTEQSNENDEQANHWLKVIDQQVDNIIWKT